MRNREWYEDSIHGIISSCLVGLPKSNIRPSYQKTKMPNAFAVNHMDKSDSMKDGVNAAKNTTNIVYFWWHFDAQDVLSTEVADDLVTTIMPFKLSISCYGCNSLENSIRLKAFFRTPDTLNAALNMDSVFTSEPRLTTFPEEINGEWWERNDLDITMSTLVTDFTFSDGSSPVVNSLGVGTGYSTSTKGKIVVKELKGGGTNGKL